MSADQAQRLRELAREQAWPKGGAAAGQRRPGSRRCRSIAVTSGKGGVGKSNISLSLAVALARLGRKVLVFDADLGLANLHILLGLTPQHNLFHVVNGECSVEDALCRGPEGITILPGSSGVAAMANLEPSRIERIQRNLVRLEDAFDFVVVDGGAGIGRTTMQLASSAETALLVLTPEPTALADAYATAKMLVSRGVDDLRVMVNMAGSARQGREIFEKLRGLVRNFLGRDLRLSAILPLDREVPRLVRMQKNPVASKPTSRFAAGIQSYARTLCGLPPARGGFFARLFSGAEKGDSVSSGQSRPAPTAGAVKEAGK
jgi:flagellar biosynthesis protein FlhG